MMEKQQSESRECEYALEISIRMAVWINKSALTDFSFKYLHQQDLKKKPWQCCYNYIIHVESQYFFFICNIEIYQIKKQLTIFKKS